MKISEVTEEESMRRLFPQSRLKEEKPLGMDIFLLDIQRRLNRSGKFESSWFDWLARDNISRNRDMPNTLETYLEVEAWFDQLIDPDAPPRPPALTDATGLRENVAYYKKRWEYFVSLGYDKHPDMVEQGTV